MTLSGEVHVESFVPKFVFYLLSKYEKFWTYGQSETPETLRCQFSIQNEQFSHINFYAPLLQFSAKVFNTKLVVNLLSQLLLKFGNFWLGRFSLVHETLAHYSLKFLGRQ